MSPSWRRSKNPSDRRCRWANRSTRRFRTNRSPTHAVRILVDPGHSALDDRDAEIERGDQRKKSREVVRGEHVVDEDLVQIDARRAERGNGAGEQQAQHHAAAEIAGVGPEPAEDGAQRDRGGVLDEAVVLVVRFVVLGCGSRPGPGRRCDRGHRFSSSSNCGKPRPPGLGGRGFSRTAAQRQLLRPSTVWWRSQCFGLRGRSGRGASRACSCLSCPSALLLRGLQWSSCLCGGLWQCDICVLCCRSGDARFGVARHVFRSRRRFVSRFPRLHSGRVVDHSLGAVKNPERDHVAGTNRTGCRSVERFRPSDSSVHHRAVTQPSAATDVRPR